MAQQCECPCSKEGFVVECIPPSMGFSRQEYWSGLPFPSPGDRPNSGIQPGSPAFQADALTSEPPGKPTWSIQLINSDRAWMPVMVLSTSGPCGKLIILVHFMVKGKQVVFARENLHSLFKSSFLALHVGTLISKCRLCECLMYYCNAISCNMPPNKTLP